MKKNLIAAVGFTILTMLSTACSQPAQNSSSAQGSSSAQASSSMPASSEESRLEKPVIAVSIVPEATFAKAVCGDLADVVTMIPPGSSPASYEPTPKEMEQLSQAKLYFAIGVPTETASILPKAADYKEMKVVKLQDEVAKIYEERKFASGTRDPHLWLSPKRAKVMVETMAKEMETIDPQNKDTYQKNAETYGKQLEELDQQLSTTFSGVKNKSFIVYHPAFGYLAEDYGLTMYALEEGGKKAAPKRLQEIVDLAKKDGAKAIFYQKEIDSKQSQAFADEIGGKTVELAPLAADYINNLKKMAETMVESIQ